MRKPQSLTWSYALGPPGGPSLGECWYHLTTWVRLWNICGTTEVMPFQNVGLFRKCFRGNRQTLNCGKLDLGRRTGRSLPAASRLRVVRRGRKVRTPQGSVPDNVRDVGLKNPWTASATEKIPPRLPLSPYGARATLEAQYPSWPGLPGTLAVA